MGRRGKVVIATMAAVSLVAAGALVLLVKRPMTTPRYDAHDWAGSGVEIAGALDATVDGSVQCWTLEAEDGTRYALVLPDTYRAFAPSLAESGMAGPDIFISGFRIWAGEEIVRPRWSASVRAQPADGEGWLAGAAAEWERLCGSADAVLVVQPGTLQPG